MLSSEQVAGLNVAFEQLAQPITDYLIQDIARRVSEAGQLTSTAAYQIWRAQNLGKSRKEIERAVADILEKTVPEVHRLFTQSAQVGYDFDINRLNPDAIPFDQNTSIQQIVSAAVQMAEDDLRNITQTMGFIAPDGQVYELTTAYQKACDFAFTQVVTGAADYNTAIYQACAKLASQGIKTIDYASGIHTTLEAAVRRNMMGGLGLMVEEISQKNHDDLGADGWEISAHAACAPDHEPIQGKQYPDREYQALNSRLVRRIGTLNCGHDAFPILLGINAPQYTAEELEQFRLDNAKGVDYEGRHFDTVYDATQYQRQIERSIRAQKNRVSVCKAQGNEKRLQTNQIKLQRLREEYKRFCKATGLREQNERLHVSGFEKTKKVYMGKGSGEDNQNKSEKGKPYKIGTVDFASKKDILQLISKMEKDTSELNYEVNYSITTDGTVWKVSGSESVVHPESIPYSLKGSYSYHNHPKDTTHYSFSADDIAFFIAYEEAYAKASDDIYEYTMRRTDKTVAKRYDEVYDRFRAIYRNDIYALSWDGLIDIDMDGYHETMKRLSEELGIEYERTKKD